MSFSSEAKAEICRLPLSRSCCALAEAYGILLFCHTFRNSEIRIVTANEAFAQRLPRLFRRAFAFGFDSETPETARGKRTFLIQTPEKIHHILSCFGQETSIAPHINLGMLENDCCRQSFLRGAFLAGGSVTDPGKQYHMEFLTAHETVARETPVIMQECGFSPRVSIKDRASVIYFKQSEAIEDVLTTLGAPLAAMSMMQAKVEKDMRNAVNRRVNCDSANVDKIISAAQEQLELIRELDRRYGLFNLPDVLQETAMLRIANPESSLAELARLANPPVSKSCMSYRLKRLLEYKEEA